MKRRFIVMFSMLVGLALPLCALAADEITQEDKIAIHAVVQSQLDALAQDDADTAFALATADSRNRLGDPDTFLRIIKEHFTPIYRHQRALFSAPEMIAGHMVQIVRLTDGDNSVWLAVYQMQREMDGNWKIEGCKLLETASVSV